MSELDELLARAIELEQKAEAGDDVDLGDLAGDLDELTADAAVELDTNEPTAEAEGEGGDEWVGTDIDPDADPEDHEALEDEPAGVDFEEPDDEPLERAEDLGRMTTDEEKAAGWGPCPSCGSTERDEFADDTARCSECGTILSPAVSKKHYDFDDLEPDDEPAVEVKSGIDTMDEMDLLRARRLELEA